MFTFECLVTLKKCRPSLHFYKGSGIKVYVSRVKVEENHEFFHSLLFLNDASNIGRTEGFREKFNSDSFNIQGISLETWKILENNTEFSIPARQWLKGTLTIFPSNLCCVHVSNFKTWASYMRTGIEYILAFIMRDIVIITRQSSITRYFHHNETLSS